MNYLPFVLRRRAFSLIEVTVALGIAAFGLLSMLGLMGIFLSSGRESGEDSNLADVAKRVASDLRARPFDGSDNSLALLKATPVPIYFDIDGIEVKNITTDAARVVYACNITLNEDAALTTSPSNNPVINRYEAKVNFTWPYPKAANKKTFHISLARYAN